MNTAHFFARNAARDADGLALAEGTKPLLTHRQLAAHAASLAYWLRTSHHLARGERVAIVMRNQPAYLEILLACWWAGLVPVPVNVNLHAKEVAVILADSDAALVFADRAIETNGVPLIAPNSTGYQAALSGPQWPLEPCAADDLAWLFYTSGTTGKPKGAMITHRNIRAMVYAYFIDIDGIGPNDAIIHAAPMSHGSGLYILPHAAVGAAQIIPESGGFEPAEIIEICRAQSGSTLFMAPTMVRRFADHVAQSDADHQGLKTIVYGGAPMYAEDLAAAHDALGFKLAQLYGQGESPMTITALNKAAHADTAHPRYQARLHSAGTAQSVCEVRTVDRDGVVLPPGAVGEIIVRGDSVVPGYWRNPEATAATMGDGWLKTGDLGSFDEDGFLTIKDRSKDLIISGGSNIYPKEIEDVLLQHPAILANSVIGVPDPEWGEIVVACVVLDPQSGLAPGDDGSVPANLAHSLDQHCLASMARFKRPKRYVALKDLPKSAYGKILKRELRDRLRPKL